MVSAYFGGYNMGQQEVYDFVRDAKLAEQYHIDKIPAVAILSNSSTPKDYGIRLYGIPSGYEFSTLIEDILMVSRQRTDLSVETLDELKKLTQPVNIQVFVREKPFKLMDIDTLDSLEKAIDVALDVQAGSRITSYGAVEKITATVLPENPFSKSHTLMVIRLNLITTHYIRTTPIHLTPRPI